MKKPDYISVVKEPVKIYNDVEVFRLKTKIGIISVEFEYLNSYVIKATINNTSQYFTPFELPPCFDSSQCPGDTECRDGKCK